MKIIIQKINTEIYLVLTYEICFLKLKIKYHHCQWGNPCYPRRFVSAVMPSAIHHKGPLRVSTGPQCCLQEGLPCVEECSLHSYGDGIEQIPTTFQQLREME